MTIATAATGILTAVVAVAAATTALLLLTITVVLGLLLAGQRGVEQVDHLTCQQNTQLFW